MYVVLYSFFGEIAKKVTSTERIIADNEYVHLIQCCLTGIGSGFAHLSVVKESAKFPIFHLGSGAPTSVTVNYIFLPDEAVVFYADGDCDVAVTGYSEPFDLGGYRRPRGGFKRERKRIGPKISETTEIKV
ncbi:MAG: hypothetical protein EZS28_008327 [Streblomastix strix]|uniref:Nucleoplasmin-like domain-containing protein n=1 Tax=Streblomastix strix TaxID=222440 RepID=A0A5J4WM38_9EUKA|nr:MAG: hypothetical protein EZS28_008327 [Streblomastix strix]